MAETSSREQAKGQARLTPKEIEKFVGPFLVAPGSRVKLPRDFDPGSTHGYTRGGSERILEAGIALLADYQARLAAEAKHGLLVVLQGMDAAGKDSTIRHVMSGVNPQGVEVHSFKVPTAEEQAHDYLWRYAARMPALGRIGIFNRSYYEEVLVVRVHSDLLRSRPFPDRGHPLKGEPLWQLRFDEINKWERYMADNGIRIVKLFLNLSKDEQRKRFLERIEQPDKNWKFTAADVRERAFWDDYQAAYSDLLSHTSTKVAPWYVIPADHKWFSRLVAAAAIGKALIDIDPHYPTVDADARASLQAARRELEREAARG